MEKKIIRIGQASNEGSQAGVVISRGGCSFTICACTHGYAIGYVLRKYEKNNSDVRFGSRRRKGLRMIRTERSEKSKRTILIGQMEGTFESSNRVYDTRACCPTINTCGGGERQPKVIRKWLERKQEYAQ